VDALIADGLRVFGPVRAAAQLEGSKVFAKEVMAAAGVQPGDKEQPLGSQLVASLANRPIIALTLLPPEPMDTAPLAASLGQPRLTLELAEGNAWVYPELGLTAHLQNDELFFLYAVPRHLLQQR
jgi:hypothetical protein